MRLACANVCMQAGSGGVLGAGRLQAMLAALLSVKIISKLSRCADAVCLQTLICGTPDRLQDRAFLDDIQAA